MSFSLTSATSPFNLSFMASFTSSFFKYTPHKNSLNLGKNYKSLGPSLDNMLDAGTLTHTSTSANNLYFLNDLYNTFNALTLCRSYLKPYCKGRKNAFLSAGI
jgi:hypothetical protein